MTDKQKRLSRMRGEDIDEEYDNHAELCTSENINKCFAEYLDPKKPASGGWYAVKPDAPRYVKEAYAFAREHLDEIREAAGYCSYSMLLGYEDKHGEQTEQVEFFGRVPRADADDEYKYMFYMHTVYYYALAGGGLMIEED